MYALMHAICLCVLDTSKSMQTFQINPSADCVLPRGRRGHSDLTELSAKTSWWRCSVQLSAHEVFTLTARFLFIQGPLSTDDGRSFSSRRSEAPFLAMFASPVIRVEEGILTSHPLVKNVRNHCASLVISSSLLGILSSSFGTTNKPPCVCPDDEAIKFPRRARSDDSRSG